MDSANLDAIEKATLQLRQWWDAHDSLDADEPIRLYLLLGAAARLAIGSGLSPKQYRELVVETAVAAAAEIRREREPSQ